MVERTQFKHGETICAVLQEVRPKVLDLKQVNASTRHRRVRDVTLNDTFRRHKRVKYVTLTTKCQTVATTPSPIIRTFIAYASESGTAQRYAGKLSDMLMERYNKTRPGYKMFSSQVVNVEALLWIDAAELVLFVASTTGEGDPPKNGRRFYDNCLLFRYFDHLPFQNVYFAVLGLGSKLYKDNFCAFGINLDRVAGDLGGTRMLPIHKCDTATLDESFSGWVEELMPRVDKICQSLPVPHVMDNSTAPPGVTEKDIVGDINKMAKSAGIPFELVEKNKYEKASKWDENKSYD